MMKPLVILGAGGFARETLDVVEAINAESPTWNILGFIVHSQYGRPGQVVNDKPILGDFDWLDLHPNVHVICGIGAPEVRHRIVNRLSHRSFAFATLVHPSVVKTRWTTIGCGVVITAGCVLSNRISIADHVHINPSATIGHDVTLGAFVSLAPGTLISGNVTVHEGAYIGTGAKIIEKKTIGAWSIVGAGAVIINNVPPNSTVVGVPAHVIKERSEGWHLE